MSGHSKWSTIKRKKAKEDAKRGKVFTKLGNEIAVAAQKGDDPDLNPDLALAIERAKEANMPNSNIERSIKRGTGELGTGPIEEVVYEGYGPGAVGIILKCATDNRNRTSADVRSAFTKNGGNMAETGAVSYQFDLKGVIAVQADDSDTAMLTAIDAGAIDVFEDDGKLFIHTNPKELKQVQDVVAQDDSIKIESADISYVPQHTVNIDDESTAQKVLNLMEVLDDLDDVVDTYTNFDIPDELAEKLDKS